MKASRQPGPSRSDAASIFNAFFLYENLPASLPRFEIVANLLAAGDIAMMVGPPKSGKSALTVRLVSSIATGQSFLDRRVEQGSVILIAAERVIETRRRIDALGPIPGLYFTGQRPQLADPGSMRELLAQLRAIVRSAELPVRLVVLDTLARCTIGLDENAAREMGVVVEALSQIADAVPTAAVVAVHHTTKSSGQLRGSGALLGGIDIELAVKVDGERRMLCVGNANAVAEGQVLPFRLEPAEVSDGTVIVAHAGHKAAASAKPRRGRTGKVLDLINELGTETVERSVLLSKLRESGDVPSERTEEATKIATEALRKALISLREAGEISSFDERLVRCR